MNLNLATCIKDLDGNDIVSDDKPRTIAALCIDALLAAYPDEPSLAGSEKLARWEIAVRIKQDPAAVELTSDEAAKIKELVGKGYSPLVVGQVWPVLDGK